MFFRDTIKKSPLLIWVVCWGFVSIFFIVAGVNIPRPWYALLAVIMAGICWTFPALTIRPLVPGIAYGHILIVWGIAFIVATYLGMILREPIANTPGSEDSVWLSVFMLASAIGGAIANTGTIILRYHTQSNRHISIGRTFIVGFVSGCIFFIAPLINTIVSYSLGMPIMRMYNKPPGLSSFLLLAWFIGGMINGLIVGKATLALQEND